MGRTRSTLAKTIYYTLYQNASISLLHGKLYRCSSLRTCMALLRYSLVSVVLLNWSLLSEVASRGLLKVVYKGWLDVTAGNWSIESSEESLLPGFHWLLISISLGVNVGKLLMVRSIVECGTLFGVVVVDELVFFVVFHLLLLMLAIVIQEFLGLRLVWAYGMQVFPQLYLVFWMWYVTAGHFVVLIHFARLLQIYRLVFSYSYLVHHILRGHTPLCWSKNILVLWYSM